MYRTGNNPNWDYQSTQELEEAQKRIDESKLPTNPKRRSTLRQEEDEDQDVEMSSTGRVPTGMPHGSDRQDTPMGGQYTPQSIIPVGGIFTSKDLLHLENENEDLRSLAEERGRRLAFADSKNIELQEQVEGMKLAFEALRQSSIPIDQTSTMTTLPAQHLHCEDYGHPKHHQDTFVCCDSTHPTDRSKISCRTCTQLALKLVDGEGQAVYNTGGVSFSVCTGCAVPMSKPCDCYTTKRCATCTENFVGRMAENARAHAGRFLFACLYCKADLTAQGKITQQCATCGGLKG